MSDQGAIRGNVSAYDVIINGCVTGDVTVAHFVELQSNARVLGNIYYQQLRMDIGATVEGKLTRLESPHTPLASLPARWPVSRRTEIQADEQQRAPPVARREQMGACGSKLAKMQQMEAARSRPRDARGDRGFERPSMRGP